MDHNFEAIYELTSDELLHIPKGRIADTIQASLNSDGDLVAVFEFAFKRFSIILSIDEINELVAQRSLPLLKSNFDEAINFASDTQITPSDVEALIEQVKTVLQLFFDLLDIIDQKLQHLDAYCLSNIHFVLLNTLHFLYEITAQDLLYSQSDMKEWLVSLQSRVTQMLENPKLQLNTCRPEMEQCRQVLQFLIRLGQKQTERKDVKSIANTWKHVSKLATNFQTVYQSIQLNEIQLNNEEDILDWLESCVENICAQITSNVQKMLTISISASETKFAISLSKFFMKLLENLAKGYANDDFRGQSHFIRLFEMVANENGKCENESTKTYLLELHTGCTSVLSSVFNCDRFSKEFLSNTQSSTIHISLRIIELLLKSSPITNEWYLDQMISHKNIMHHLLFKCIPTEMIQLYQSDNLYDEVVILSVALLTVTATGQHTLENTLIEATLDGNIFLLPVLMDIWVQFLRYCSNENRLSYCKLWLSVIEHESVLPRNPSSVLIHKLLKYTISLLPDSQHTQILQEHEIELPMLLRLSSGRPPNEKCKQTHLQDVVKNMKETLTKLNPKSEVVTTNECLELMNGLACFQLPPHQQLLRMVNDPQLTNCLTDALSRSKTRHVPLLVSGILRVLLWQKYLCGNSNVQIDYSDSPEIEKSVAIELISLMSGQNNANISSVLSTIKHTDDLTRLRILKVIPSACKSDQNGTTDGISDEMNYLKGIMQLYRSFGCNSMDSCLDNSAVFKRGFEQMLHEANKMKHALENNSHLNLSQFAQEINFLSNFVNNLQNKF